MAKSVANSVLDAALAKIATSTRLVLCSGEPANFAGIAAVALADVVIDGDDFSGPADGDVSGRKITVAAQNDVEVDATGTGTHLALDDGTTLLYVTTTASQAVSLGGTVNIGAWKAEIADPA